MGILAEGGGGGGPSIRSAEIWQGFGWNVREGEGMRGRTDRTDRDKLADGNDGIPRREGGGDGMKRQRELATTSGRFANN